ncbi:MAG: trypsin-like peptidase domain-containing protein [Euryarchaeota archaeon]|nr:trypsin-like peptidase domain-containing protein [Euryarchaeota archaeon]
MNWSTPKSLVAIVVLTVVCSGLTAGVLVGSGLVTPGPTVEGPTATDGPIDSERLYTETIDSVVTVYVVGESGSSSGSGFVYDDAEHLVTNHHVIDGAETVEVKFGARGEWRRATVVGSDRRTDLAVLDIDDLPASARPLSTTNESPQQGAPVVAIGSPLRLEGTITTGTISGVDRSLRLPSGPLVPDAIQTDAAINPGNSGGPLLDREGRVLGVNTARADGDNIGFVVSAATVDRVVPSLIETGSYTHPYLGVDTRTVVPAIATANDLNETSGAVVVGVDSGGPAAGTIRGPQRAETVDGQRVPVGGDVIVAINDTRIETDHDLLRYIALETEPGETVAVELIREGQRRTVSVELGARPS